MNERSDDCVKASFREIISEKINEEKERIQEERELKQEIETPPIHHIFNIPESKVFIFCHQSFSHNLVPFLLPVPLLSSLPLPLYLIMQSIFSQKNLSLFISNRLNYTD